MKVDCQWFSDNMEAYVCETLDAERSHFAQEHLASCPACQAEVRSLESIDPLVREVFRYRLAQAETLPQAYPQRQIWQVGLAAAALAGIALLGVNVFWREAPAPVATSVASAPIVQAPAPTTVAPDIKNTESGPVARAKPADTPAPRNIPNAAPAPIPADAPDFAVIDPAGYATTIESYRGYVLLVGVWSKDRPETASSLEQIYQTFGKNPKVRVLGVSREHQDRLSGTTFPMAFNHGSRLLGIGNAEFVLIDATGKVRLRESLLDGAKLVSRIREFLATD